jgi:hypothetical protein
MLINGGFCLAKQGCHLVLGKPNGFFFKPNIYFDIAFLILINDYFAVLQLSIVFFIL